MQAEGHPWLFAAGDCAVVHGHEGLARVGVHAVKQGPLLLDNLLAYARGASLASFSPYPVAPLLVSTGARDAYWAAGPVWLRGRSVLALKNALDRRWMNRYALSTHPTPTAPRRS